MSCRIQLFIASFIMSSTAAFAQSGEDDILSIISLCASADSIPAGSLTGVLSFLESAEESDTVRPGQDVFQQPQAGPGHGIGILSAIAEAYSSNGYYASGAWIRDENILYPASLTPPVAGIPFISQRPARITSGYGYREKRHRMHYGVDIAMCVGDTIKLSMPGTVSYVGYDARGYGHYIIISHANDMETRYAHLSKPLVMAGRILAEGEPIALSGNTGNSTGPHLHLETRYRGIPVNPLMVFAFSSADPPAK